MKTKYILCWVMCAAVAFGVQAQDPLGINIFDAQYTTDVATSGFYVPPYPELHTNYSRTMVSPVPVSDSLYHPAAGEVEAEANAGLFSISVFTAAVGGRYDPWTENSYARAESDIWFSPLTYETTTITIQFSGWHEWYYSGGSVGLLNVTSNQELWNYGWSYGVSGTVPWVVNFEYEPRATATLTLDTEFIAGDTYKLTMSTWTDSNPPDTEHILIQLFGLQPVPEPSTFALLGLGSLALAMVRRHRQA